MSKPTVKIAQARGALRCAAVSDVGMRRTSNQDSLAIALAEDDGQWECRGHLFVVADGMGAHAAGELASQIAVDSIPLAYLKHRDSSPCEAIVAAVHEANNRIYGKGQNSVDFHGMGTTCSCLLLLQDGALAAHVGDSRVYRLRGQSLEQLTFDHSLVWEMAAAGHASEEEIPAYVPKNVITRSLGPHPTVKVDLEGPLPIHAGDRYLLCSDGLTGPLEPQLIGMVVASLPPEEASQTLVDLANLLGGPDNITAIVVEVADPAQLGGSSTFKWSDCAPAAPTSIFEGLRWEHGLLLGGGALGGATLAGGLAVGNAIVAAVGALVGIGALVAWFTVKSSQKGGNGRVAGSFGKGPYRKHRGAPNAENIALLSEIVRQLEDLEGQRDWPIDWPAIHKDRQQAHEAISHSDFPAAVVSYSRAVRTLMQAVRAQPRGAAKRLQHPPGGGLTGGNPAEARPNACEFSARPALPELSFRRGPPLCYSAARLPWLLAPRSATAPAARTTALRSSDFWSLVLGCSSASRLTLCLCSVLIARMRILTRYILWELGSVFLVTLATMTLFMFFALLGKEAVDNGLGLTPILRMLPFMLPQAMQFAVPGAMLLAAAVVYGRVSASNEIVAVKSLGITPMVMVWPSFILAAVTSLSTVVLNDVAVSWGHDGVERVVLESLEEIAYGRLRTVKSYSTDRLKVNVKSVVGKKLIRPIIQVSSSGNRPPSLITAELAELHADPTKNAVTIRLWGADGNVADWSIVHPGVFEQSLPLDEFLGRKSNTRTPSYYALREIGPSKILEEGKIESIKSVMAADAGAAMLLGESDRLSVPEWHGREHDLKSAQETLYRLQTEPYRRWSNGFSCLSFVLIGAPMAIRRRHGEFWGSFFACFLPILIVYYPMLVGCVDKAKDGVLPPPTVWMGNIVLALWGAWLMRRVVRY